MEGYTMEAGKDRDLVCEGYVETVASELVTATFEAGAAALGVERVCDVLVEELCSAWITPRDFTSG